VKRFVSLCLVSLAGLAFAGCQPEPEIIRQEAPRVTKMQRFLGAIIPREEKTWSLKLVGAEQQIEDVKDSYDSFVRSIHFSKDKDEPTWKLPAGWTEVSQDKLDENVRKLRFATLKTGGQPSLEVTVASLQGEEARKIEPNINRWRQQIGLKSIPPRDRDLLEEFYRTEIIAGVLFYLVDMLGPGLSRPVQAPPLQKDLKPGPPPKLDFKYQVPEGWRQAEGDGFSALAFVALEGNQRARITVTRAGGSLLDNVNRWRDQVGLERIKEAGLAQVVADFPMEGGKAKAKYVDLIGPAKGANVPNRIVGAILDRNGATWFFKMSGPAEWVGKQRPNFEAFLKSIQFEAP